ncbi:MAG TPA: hypothetical protein DCY13_15280, partial [Verrucomicrobiales bacterium]|nr:hypothetical protein [Verrucomicrobiales bacterium]
SLLVAGAVCLLGTALGGAVAVWMAGLGGRARAFALVGCVVTAALPPFLVVNSWIDLFGRTGSLQLALPFELYSFTGCAVLLACLFWPVAALLVFGSLRQLNPDLLEADAELRGGSFIRQLLLPQARTAIAQSAGLIFVLALNQFSVPAILQVRIYPEELWLRFNTTFNYREALLLSWPMVVFPLALMGWLARHPIAWPRGLRAWRPTEFRRALGAGMFVGCAALAVLTFAVSLALPLGQLLLSPMTWNRLSDAYAAGGAAAVQSVMIAVVPAVLVVALGWVLSRTRWAAWLWPVFFLPGVLLGIALIFLMNRNGLDWVYSTVLVLFLALSLRYLAPAWYGARLIRQGLDRDLVDAGRLGGATGWQRWLLVDWPQARGELLALGYVIYLLCLWDVETINLIVPAGGETLALRIFNLLHYGHNGEVNALCLLLLLLALLPLAAGAVVARLADTKGGQR